MGLACTGLGTGLPNAVFLEAAEPITELGHPQSRFLRAEVVGRRSGAADFERYVDVDSHYRRKKTGSEHLLKLRFYVHDLDPCRISLSVLSDTGPPPVLLDNAIAKDAIAERMCDEVVRHGLADR